MRTFKGWDDADIQSIKLPSLIINGDNDVILTEHALKLQVNSNAALIVLPGVHGALHWRSCQTLPGSKQPAITVELVKEFLDK